MNPAEKDQRRRRIFLRRLEQEGKNALDRLKQRYPNDYPAIHLRVIEECDGLRSVALTLPRPELPCPPRLDFAIRLMDAWAGGYLSLVHTLPDHEDYAILLQSYVRKAWVIYRGIAEIEPFGPNRQLATIQDRSLHWYKESLRRLVKTPEPQPAENVVASRRGYRAEVRAWMKRKNLEKVSMAAKRLGVSESTLKSIMSSKGRARYGADVLKRILGEIDPPS